MLAHAGCLTGGRVGGRHVLAVNDTTDLRFPRHDASKQGFGRDANDTCPGLFLHPVLAVDASHGGVIGLVHGEVLNRTADKVTDHKKRAADDKESRRWLHGAEIAAERLAAAQTITLVGDRESDIYDLFARRPANVHLLCRSAHPRAMTTGGRLPAYCAALAQAGRATIDVPPKGRQKARQATVALRFGPVDLKRLVRARATAQPDAISLWVVDVRELDPPHGAEPVHWRLLTTHTIETLADARQVVGWYRLRWTIEQVFRSLKSHCLRIEDSQMQQAGCFIKLAMIALIAAVRAMQLVAVRAYWRAMGRACSRSPTRWRRANRWRCVSSMRRWKAAPPSYATRTRRTCWLGPPGSSPVSADGRATPPAATSPQAPRPCITA
jgi:hypothetical protein